MNAKACGKEHEYGTLHGLAIHCVGMNWNIL